MYCHELEGVVQLFLKKEKMIAHFVCNKIVIIKLNC